MMSFVLSCINLFFIAFVLIAPIASASTYEISLSSGAYDPHDGLVKNLYDTDKPVYMMHFNIQRPDGLGWASSFLYYDFDNSVANLKNDIELMTVMTGFRKKFIDTYKDKLFGAEPYFGASAGYAFLSTKGQNRDSGRSYKKVTENSLVTSWDIGISLTDILIESFDIDFKITNLSIEKKLFGNIDIGGRIFSVGFQYRFGNTAAR